ncbi:hypothetical protein ACPPVO_43465 [Dactylosporangium sp. McL0621]|uniref:hypothetical protein n=1 Tax=Dactylosporangium sp. McL0621 TaxID=3415678 RepID=UPI003CE96684
MEYEPGWAALARANIELARRQGGTGHDRVVRGDATTLPHGIPLELHGQISLVLTSPPYGKTMHGRVEHRRGPLTRFHNTYSQHPPHATAEIQAAGPSAAEPANLAHRGRAGLLDGITAVLAGCVPLLKPGGIIAVVSRPWRRDHFLVDLPGQTIQAGQAAGLQLVGCRRAVHAAVRDGRLVAHPLILSTARGPSQPPQERSDQPYPARRHRRVPEIQVWHPGCAQVVHVSRPPPAHKTAPADDDTTKPHPQSGTRAGGSAAHPSGLLVAPPNESPTITPNAARALLKILLVAHEARHQGG